MDDTHDTQTSVKSTADAGATRKRRSSILKSQRPPRTPLSELEFNVATPTDTAKSRRVSFSRRTGVAEFVTNEATTTWKNFYEEHNKSLENSGNDSMVNAPRHMSIGHIGKRIFDQQFEEVEIIEVGGTLQTRPLAQDFHASLNNLNITQQLAALECPIDDKKLVAPLQNFELSSFTDNQSKIFRDDLTVPTMPDMTNPIDVNFSLQPVRSKNDCDDLDEIVKDLERSQQPNIVCPGPFNGDNMSEYIEIDLNMTHVGVKNDVCEMSITDTIRNPEVQEVSKSISSIHKEKKPNIEDDWIVDKENIAINPYIAPKESKNFAINNSSDKILVFDGKKLTVKSETIPNVGNKDNFRNTLLPDLPMDAKPKRKIIVLNTNDDLPNFVSENSAIIGNHGENFSDTSQLRQSVKYNENDLSMTQSVNNKVEVNKRKTIVFEDDMGNISVTQAVPAKVIINEQEKRKTIIYDSDLANISVTQAIPTNIIGANKTVLEKRKTVVYENDISFTQALPANLILNNIAKVSQDKTMYYQDVVDMSVTQVIPDNLINVVQNKSNSNISNVPSNTTDVKPNNSLKTLIFDTNEDLNIELTEAVSANVLLSAKRSAEKRKTIVLEEDISITQAVPANILLEKRKTIVFEKDNDISLTQALPANIFLDKFEIKCDMELEAVVHEQNIISNKSNDKYVKIENDCCSVDQKENLSTKRKTIIFNDDTGDISMTQVMPSNILMMETEAENMEISSEHDVVDISITRALPTNILQKPDLDKSIIQDVSTLTLPDTATCSLNMLSNLNNIKNEDALFQLNDEIETKLQPEVHETIESNSSMTKPIPNNIIVHKELFKEIDACEEKNLLIQKNDDLLKNNLSMQQDILVYQAVDQTLSQNENENSLKISQSENVNKFNNDIVEENLENIAIIHSFTTESKHCFDNKKFENHIKEETCMKNENVSKQTTAVSEIISKTRDETLKAKKSFLSELLDMSNASLETVAKTDKCANEFVNEDKLTNGDIKANGNNDGKSDESLFVITRDTDDEEKEDNVSRPSESSLRYEPENKEVPPAIELIEVSDDVQDLHNKIAELKAVNQLKNDSPKSSNRHYERVISSDLYEDIEYLNKTETTDKSVKRSKKSFKHADDTRELLGMLSDFTEGEVEELKSDKPTSAIELKDNLAIENKYEPKRLSFIPKRQSIALSREDLLNNISMAQAALQQSRFEVDENESIEETQDSPEEIVESERSRRKSVRISTEVVKALQFDDDDTVSEASLESSFKRSPLKKTAFGETSYMREDKAKVIPSYLKDVSDNLKALMSDLVKPMADVMPFESGLDKTLKSSVSTCSTQIQANLVTSSQIDVDVELHSNCESIENIRNAKRIQSPKKVHVEKPALHKIDREVTRSIHSVSLSASMEIDQSPRTSPILKPSKPRPIPHSSIDGPTIVFDHHNPLNNILLAPIDGVKVHKYNPIKSTETMHSEHKDSTHIDKVSENPVEVARFSTHYNVDSVCQQKSSLQAGDNCVEILKDTNSLTSNISKPLSIDRSTDGLVMEVKDTEVNTLIAMKANKELLEASSSLTLVDDALASSVFDIKIENKVKETGRKSPLRVIYHMETDGDLMQKIDSDVASITSNVEEDSDNSNSRKRSYSPVKTKHDDSKLNIETTPKPVNKMQKISNSPSISKKIERLDELIMCLDKMDSVTKMDDDNSPKKSSKRDKIVVQCASIEYNRDISDRKPIESIDSSKFEGAKSMEIVSSFTSSKRAREMQDVESAVSGSNQSNNSSSNTSSLDCMNWQTDLTASSRNLSECISNVNVVDKINMMKCMGRDCEWESSVGDVWVFRLLRSRVRLTARLAHRHHNAARSRVLADTPLESVDVECVRLGEAKDPLAALCVRLLAEEEDALRVRGAGEAKDPLAALCVRLSAEAMRYECAGRGGCGTCGAARAGDVPGALARCAHVARCALRWARHMRNARYRLAYSVREDGELALKVANIPLRSVWEVRMRLELVVGDAREGAWPRATDVRACAVLADSAATARPDLDALVAALPHDWRHAPAALWTVFKYLKNKTRDNEQFLGL